MGRKSPHLKTHKNQQLNKITAKKTGKKVWVGFVGCILTQHLVVRHLGFSPFVGAGPWGSLPRSPTSLLISSVMALASSEPRGQSSSSMLSARICSSSVAVRLIAVPVLVIGFLPPVVRPRPLVPPNGL